MTGDEYIQQLKDRLQEAQEAAQAIALDITMLETELQWCDLVPYYAEKQAALESGSKDAERQYQMIEKRYNGWPVSIADWWHNDPADREG